MSETAPTESTDRTLHVTNCDLFSKRKTLLLWLSQKLYADDVKLCVCVFFFQKYKEYERAVRVEEIDGLSLVKRLAEDMEEMFHKKAQAMKVPHPSR